MIWLQTSTYSCEPTPQSLSPYNHSLGQKFIAIIRDWWYPRKKKKKVVQGLPDPNSLSAQDGWFWSVSVTQRWTAWALSWMGAELRHHFTCPEGTGRHYQPWQLTHSKSWGGKSLLSICRGTSKVLWHLEIGFTVGEHLWLLSVPFTVLSNTYCLLPMFFIWVVSS